MGVEDVIVHSSKDGHDENGINYETLFARSQAGIKSDHVWEATMSIYELKSFAQTCEPRLRPFLTHVADIGKISLASFGSVGNATLKAISTTTQKSEVRQETSQAQRKVSKMFGGKDHVQYED